MSPGRTHASLLGDDAGEQSQVSPRLGTETVLREAGAERSTAESWVGCPGRGGVSLWVPGRGVGLDTVLTSLGGRCTVHRQSSHGNYTWVSPTLVPGSEERRGIAELAQLPPRPFQESEGQIQGQSYALKTKLCHRTSHPAWNRL